MTAPTWHWLVVYSTADTYHDVTSVRAPHRAAAKQQVADRYAGTGVEITDWDRCFVPKPSWDCPICGTHESMAKRPNLKTPPDWECRVCGTYGWGDPMDWEYLSEPHDTQGSPMTGHKQPDGPVAEAPTEVNF